MTESLTQEPAIEANRSILLDINRLFSRGEHSAALKLAHQTVSDHPKDVQLLNIIGRIYLRIGEPQKAAIYLKRALKKEEPATYSHTTLNSSDLDYLQESAESLQEDEYKIASDDSYSVRSDEDKAVGRPILTLKKGFRRARECKDRTQHSPPNPSQDDSNKSVSITCRDDQATQSPKRPILRLKKKRSNTTIQQESRDSKYKSEVATHDTEANEDFDQVNSFLPVEIAPPVEQEDSVLEQLSLYSEEEDESAEEDLYLNDLPEQTQPNIVTNEDVTTFPDTHQSSNDVSTDFYDFWTEEEFIEEEDDEDADQSNFITRRQRAQQVAVQFIDFVGWPKSDLDLVTEIFFENGWSATKASLLREVSLGASIEEISLARELKHIWRECDRYWISFSSINRFLEHTSASYKHFSWTQALRIIRTYDGVPSIEELHHMLEIEFEYWYSHIILRRKYPAFIKYLLYYRFGDHPNILPSTEQLMFFDSFEEDYLDSIELSLERSDTYLVLSEMGVDLHSNFTTKSYYVSDIPFDPEKGELLLPDRKNKRAVTNKDDEESDEYNSED